MLDDDVDAAPVRQLSHARHGTLEWQARIGVLRELMSRHIQSEEGSLFADLDERFSGDELVELGRQFVLARDKLAMLEEVKKEEARKAA